MTNPTTPAQDGIGFVDAPQPDYAVLEERIVSDAVNVRLNATLKNVDSILCAAMGAPEQQMGVAMMAVVLAARRFLAQNNVTDRGRRMRVIKEAVRQFESKLRHYVKER